MTSAVEIGELLHDPSSLKKDDLMYCFKSLEELRNHDGNGRFEPISELYVLCCESAIALNVFDVAKICVERLSTEHLPTVGLTARSLYCTALVRNNSIPQSRRGKELVDEKQVCISYVIQGLAHAVSEYPSDAWVVTAGLNHLWRLVEKLFFIGKFEDIIDVVFFAVSLFEKLLCTGFEYSRVQWLLRYAQCCRGAGKYQEALNQFSAALEIATQVENDRLYVQILRMVASLVAERDGKGAKLKNEGIFAKQPLFQAVFLTQLFFMGNIEGQMAATELVSVFEHVKSYIQQSVGEEPNATTIANSSRPKSKASRQSTADGAVSVSTGVAEEIFSDVVLALVLLKKKSETNDAIDKLLLTSTNPRCKTVGMYCHAITQGLENGVFDFSEAIDLSYLSKSALGKIKKCIHEVETALDTSRMIEDLSEQKYVLQMGCSILWLICLPLLQESTLNYVKHTINKIHSILQDTATNPSQLRLFVELTYQACLVEMENDNIGKVSDWVQEALSCDYSFTLIDGTTVFPMDFPFLWLLYRTRVKSLSGVFSNPPDEVLYNLEQVKMISSASKRLVLIKAAFSKLPPLTQIAEKDTSACSENAGETKSIAMKTKKEGATAVKGVNASKEKSKPGPIEEAAAPAIVEESLVSLYISLLRECMKELSPSITPVALSVSKSLCNIELPILEQNRQLLLMKAEGHQSFADVLLAESSTEGETLTPAARSDIVKNLLQAAKIGHLLSKINVKCAYVVINSCQRFLELVQPIFFTENFIQGNELALFYEYYTSVHLNFEDESALTVELAFYYIVSLLSSYLKTKSEKAPKIWKSYTEFYNIVSNFSKSDSASATLKKALEVCQDTMQRIRVPSEKAVITTLFPVVCRLLGGVKVEVAYHPQDQLLFLLGRASGPVSKDEKVSFVCKEGLELLRSDPSVELCGRLCALAMDLSDEQTALDLCDIAEGLYKDGKLGWGTLYYPTAKATLTAAQEAAERRNLTSVSGSKRDNLPLLVKNPEYPRPKPSDWIWYSNLLLTQASIYLGRLLSMDLHSSQQLGLKVIQLCTNAAIAASYGTASSRMSLVIRAFELYYKEVCRLRASGVEESAFVPSLKIVLSKHILSQLSLASTNRISDSVQEKLLTSVTVLGRLLLIGCTQKQDLEGGVLVVNNLLKMLPTRFQSLISEEEIAARAKLSLPVASTIRVAKSAGAEAEALAWLSLARATNDDSQRIEAWLSAIEVVKEFPLAYANNMCSFAEYLILKGTESCKNVKLLLLSALDNAEKCLPVALQSRTTNRRNWLLSTHMSLTQTKSRFAKEAGSSKMNSTGMHTISKNSNRGSKGGQLSFLSELTAAVRVLYNLSLLSSDSKVDSFPSKRDCMLLILLHVRSMWDVVADAISEPSKAFGNSSGEVDSKLPNGDDNTPGLTEEFHIPSETTSWFGFVIDRKAAARRIREKTNDLHWCFQVSHAVFLDLCEYLIHDSMEMHCFMIYQWVDLCATLAYGEEHTKANVMHFCVNLLSQKTACLCGAGTEGAEFYPLGKVSSKFWAAIENELCQIRIADWQPKSKIVPNFSGSFHQLLLNAAECLYTLGDIELSEQMFSCVKKIVWQIKDNEGICRCAIADCQLGLVKRWDWSSFVELFETETTFLSFVPPNLWVKWQMQKAYVCLILKKEEQLNLLLLNSVVPMKRSFEKKASEDDDVYGYLYSLGFETIQKGLDIFIADNINEIFRLERVSDLIAESLERLQKSSLIKQRCLGIEGALKVRSRVTEDMLLKPTDDDINEAQWFDTFSKELTLLETLLLDTQHLSKSIDLLGPCDFVSSVQIVESKVLCMMATVYEEMQCILQYVVRKYRCLSMENLNLPKTGAPSSLEENVLNYMRDPSRTVRDPAEELREIKSLWFYLPCEPTSEVINALEHFKLKVDMSLLSKCSKLNILTIYHSAFNILFGTGSLSLNNAIISILRTEYKKIFELNLDLETFVKSESKSLLHRAVNTAWRVYESLPSDQVMPLERSKTPKGKAQIPNEIGTTGSTPAFDDESDVMKLTRSIVTDAVARLDFEVAFECFCLLADLCILWKRPQEAGVFIEKAQTASLFVFLIKQNVLHYSQHEEANCYRYFAQAIKKENGVYLNYPRVLLLRDKLVSNSPLFNQGGTLCSFPNFTETTQGSFNDYVVLSISKCNEAQTYMSSLRQTDGTFKVSRSMLDEQALQAWNADYQNYIKMKKAISQAVKSGNDTKSPEMEQLLEHLNDLLSPIWSPFADILKLHGTKHTLYLCLDPVLQPFPFEHISIFSTFHNISRELSSETIVRKSLQKVVKSSGLPVYIIDPFGDNVGAIETLLSSESKAKSVVLSSASPKYPISKDVLSWYLANKKSTSIFLQMCGSLFTAVSARMVSNINLTHILSATFVADGVSDSSIRREQKEQMYKNDTSCLVEDEQWVICLLLLARGARSVSQNTFPAPSATSLLLAKKSFAQAAAGNKGATEGKEGKYKKEYFTYYGVPPAIQKK